MQSPSTNSPEFELDLLKEAIGSSICGVTIADVRLPDMPLIFINKAFEKLTGYPTSEVLGKNCRFLQGELKDQPGVMELKIAMRNQVSCTVLLKNFKKNGELFWNELILSPIFDERGELTHYVGIQNDVTEREAMRLELSRSTQELQMAVKRLRQLMDDKNRLLSVVAHDLRSPLSNIIGLNQLMLQESCENNPDGYLEITLAEAQNAFELVNTLMSEQAIASGKLTIDKRPTELAKFSDSIARELGAKAGQKGMELSVKNFFEVEAFPMDAMKVKQVLQNLVGNAIKFSERGSTIELELRASASRFSFTVCDRGQGIQPDELDKIFRTFENASTKATEGEAGFGVGLSIVKEIVELHGGEITVESKVGEGSCFTVMLW